MREDFVSLRDEERSGCLSLPIRSTRTWILREIPWRNCHSLFPSVLYLSSIIRSQPSNSIRRRISLSTIPSRKYSHLEFPLRFIQWLREESPFRVLSAITMTRTRSAKGRSSLVESLRRPIWSSRMSRTVISRRICGLILTIPRAKTSTKDWLKSRALSISREMRKGREFRENSEKNRWQETSSHSSWRRIFLVVESPRERTTW